MTTKRWSRGFHRLGVMVAALALITGVIFAAIIVVPEYTRTQENTKIANCLLDYLRKEIAEKQMVSVDRVEIELELDRKVCPGGTFWGRTDGAKLMEIANRSMGAMYALGAISVALGALVGAAAYCLFRLLGWVITGFSSER